MTASLTRRMTLFGIAAPILGVTKALTHATAAAAEGPTQATIKTPGETSMPAIQRFESTPAIPGIPLISWAVAHGEVVQISGITGSPGVTSHNKHARSWQGSTNSSPKRTPTRPG